jgi:hypothetical protein
VDDDAQPGLRLEQRALAVVAEPHALELVALVLEREVRVPADDTVTRPISPSTHTIESAGPGGSPCGPRG